MTETMKMNPNWSEAYQRAMLEGKKVMFICDKGHTRSPMAALASRRRGEDNTVSLDGGVLHLKDQNLSDQQLDTKLIELTSKNILRIFTDYETNMLGRVIERLDYLVKTRKIKKTDYELITVKNFMLENKRDPDFIIAFAQSIMND